jgi:CDP-glycerol glycerophosphotransferase (TagB/SpsB family)
VNTERSRREEFFASMNLDPAKKTILFAPAGTILSDTDLDIVDIFKKALDEKKLISPIQLLIRNHPNHPADFSPVSDRKDMVIENPGKVFNVNNPKETELTLKDNEHLADELFYSDVIVWVATTLPLDAAIFDKPLIAVNFDGYEEKSYYESVRRYHDEDHMKKMLDCNGVKVADSKEDLIEIINMYLMDPSLDKEGRDAIIRQQFYGLDGKAGRRIGEYLLSFLNK